MIKYYINWLRLQATQVYSPQWEWQINNTNYMRESDKGEDKETVCDHN